MVKAGLSVNYKGQNSHVGQKLIRIGIKSRFQCKKPFSVSNLGLRMYRWALCELTLHLAFFLPGIYPRETLEHVHKETSSGRLPPLTFIGVEISI